MFKISSSILLIILISACASTSMSLEECQSTNWNDKGKSDAVSGLIQQYDNYKEDCSDANINVDTAAYQTGFEQGLLTYCTSETGYEMGKKGVQFHKPCVNSNLYAKGYKKGFDIYYNNRERNQLKSLNQENNAKRHNPRGVPDNG